MGQIGWVFDGARRPRRGESCQGSWNCLRWFKQRRASLPTGLPASRSGGTLLNRLGGEYLTGLMIAERKSVSGINREFAETTDQSQHCSALGLLGRPFYLSGRHAFCAGRGMSYMCAHGHSKLTEDAGRVGVDAGEHR